MGGFIGRCICGWITRLTRFGRLHGCLARRQGYGVQKYLEMQDLVGQTVEILYANRRKVLSWRIDGRIGNRRADTAVRIVTRRVEMILQGGSVLYFLTGGYLLILTEDAVRGFGRRQPEDTHALLLR